MVQNGAQRASRQSRSGRTLALLAALMAILVLISLPASASAASFKVVIVVGPVEGSTARYRADANLLAQVATAHGATVVKVYSPNATWRRVKAAAQGANVLIYLGHGNGTPSPYPYSPYTKNGLGLNRLLNHGNSNVKYYGSYYMRYIHLAPNGIVILNHLCYSAGNSEPGRAAPSTRVARQRVAYYAAGMMKTGAVAVFAEPKGDARYILTGLFTTTKTLRQIFTDHGAAPTNFTSTRVPGATITAKLTVRALTTLPGVTAGDVLAASAP